MERFTRPVTSVLLHKLLRAENISIVNYIYIINIALIAAFRRSPHLTSPVIDKVKWVTLTGKLSCGPAAYVTLPYFQEYRTFIEWSQEMGQVLIFFLMRIK